MFWLLASRGQKVIYVIETNLSTKIMAQGRQRKYLNKFPAQGRTRSRKVAQGLHKVCTRSPKVAQGRYKKILCNRILRPIQTNTAADTRQKLRPMQQHIAANTCKYCCQYKKTLQPIQQQILRSIHENTAANNREYCLQYKKYCSQYKQILRPIQTNTAAKLPPGLPLMPYR